MKEHIRLCGKNFEIRRNPRRKHIAVGVDHTGKWFVGAPDFYSKERLVKILTEDEDVKKIIAKVEKRAEPVPAARFFDEGGEIMFRGEKFPLKWTDESEAPPLEFRDDAFYFSSLRRGMETETLELWYARQLYYMLRELLPVWTKKLGVAPEKVSVKSVKSMWGSCSRKNSLTFSSRLALVPCELLEYVVVHELVHLKHMDHSTRFWEEVERHLPDYRTKRASLRRNSANYRWR